MLQNRNHAFQPRLRGPLLWLVAGVLLGACRENQQIPLSPSLESSSQVSISQRSIITVDDALKQIGERLPGFGGMYVNGEDELVMLLRDSSLAPQSRDAVVQVLGRIPGRSDAPSSNRIGCVYLHRVAELDAATP